MDRYNCSSLVPYLVGVIVGARPCLRLSADRSFAVGEVKTETLAFESDTVVSSEVPLLGHNAGNTLPKLHSSTVDGN